MIILPLNALQHLDLPAKSIVVSCDVTYVVSAAPRCLIAPPPNDVTSQEIKRGALWEQETHYHFFLIFRGHLVQTSDGRN
jgi:hypothetical protein